MLALTLSAIKAGNYTVPHPHRAQLMLNFACGVQNIYLKDDFFVSFSSFTPFLPSQFQISRSVIETNRCFFIHLGVATGFHPVLLQGYFRNAAALLLRSIPSDDMRVELLQSVMQYAGFVDANVLCLLWPREFSERGYRVCFLCGSLRNPMFISFIPSDSVFIYVVIYILYIKKSNNRKCILYFIFISECFGATRHRDLLRRLSFYIVIFAK